MHRNRTQFASRVGHYAAALERRGIRATYALHDRMLSNRDSRRRYSGSAAALDDAQQSIVSDLDAQGYATRDFTALFPDDWPEVDAWGARFMSAAEGTGETAEAERIHRREGKEFVVRRYDRHDQVADDDAWFAFSASRRMLDLANAYLRMWSKLEYVDLWYTPPVPYDKERVSSQHWHRDFNDRHLLKTFLYLVDVDEGAGPFEYIPGSAGNGSYAAEWPWRPLGTTYPGDETFASRIPDSAVKTFTAPKGTIVFCNTSGFHRGGFATEKPRVLATATYCSPASLASLTERNFAPPASFASPTDPVVAYALS